MIPPFIQTLVLTPLFHAARTYLALLKIIIPILIMVKVLIYFNGLTVLDMLLSPVLATLDLPVEAAIVFATAIATGVGGGVILYLSLAAEASFTVSQVTTLSILILFAHALPMELAICKRLGGRVTYLLPLRLLTAYAAAFILFHVNSYFGWQQMAAEPMLAVDLVPGQQSFFEELVAHIYYLLSIFMIIYGLLVLRASAGLIMLKTNLQARADNFFEKIGLEKHMAESVVTGFLLGILYGGSLLIQSMREHSFTKRELFLVVTLLSLVHSLIEDTLLVMMMGAPLFEVLVYKNLFGLLVFFVIMKLTAKSADAVANLE